MTVEEIDRIMQCLNAMQKTFQKGECIFHAGQQITELGLVLSGSVNIVVNHYWGDSTIFGHVPAGEVFAEAYAAAPDIPLNSDVVAAEHTRVLFLSLRRILVPCSHVCAFHQRLIQNLVSISAHKNIALSTRMLDTAPRLIRDRLLSYFSHLATATQSNVVRTPFSRQQLANYLGVERSALSNELSKMQKDGLIVVRKNEFELLKQ